MASEKGYFYEKTKKGVFFFFFFFFFFFCCCCCCFLELSENGLGRVSQFFVQTLVLIS